MTSLCNFKFFSLIVRIYSKEFVDTQFLKIHQEMAELRRLLCLKVQNIEKSKIAENLNSLFSHGNDVITIRKYFFRKNNNENNTLGHLVAISREKSIFFEIPDMTSVNPQNDQGTTRNRPDDTQGRIPHIPGVNLAQVNILQQGGERDPRWPIV